MSAEGIILTGETHGAAKAREANAVRQARSFRRVAGMLVAFALFAAAVGYFSNRPEYRHLAADSATIKLSLRHAGQLMGECRERSAAELAQMPASMRAPLVCPRERSPLVLELELDGRLMLSKTLPARGIHQDGRASTYERLTVPAGEFEVVVRLKDHIEAEEFQYQARRTLSLVPGANLVIDFDEEAGEFEFL